MHHKTTGHRSPKVQYRIHPCGFRWAVGSSHEETPPPADVRNSAQNSCSSNAPAVAHFNSQTKKIAPSHSEAFSALLFRWSSAGAEEAQPRAPQNFPVNEVGQGRLPAGPGGARERRNTARRNPPPTERVPARRTGSPPRHRRVGGG